MKPQGAKQVREAVLIAALCSVATGLISWGIDEARRRVDRAKGKKKPKRRKVGA